MIPGHIMRIVALYEAKTLWRSWFFRIFSALALIVIVLLDIIIFATPFAQWMNRGLPGSVPYMNLVLLTVAQAVIGAFIAPEFLKFDRSLDTTEAVYARSMTNAEYVIGKSLGVLAVFVILNLLVLAISFVFQFFFTEVPIAPLVYLYYPLLLSVPTIVYIFGLSFLVMSVVRSQAVTFAILLGYIAATLFFLGGQMHGLFDYMGLRTPLMYSDFVGFGGLGDTLLLRGMYLSIGLGCIFATIMLMKRLVQSRTIWVFSATCAIAFIFGGFVLGGMYFGSFMGAAQMRASVRALNEKIVKEPTLTLDACSLTVNHRGNEIEAEARLTVSNATAAPIGQYRFTLNPGFKVAAVTRGGASLPFERDLHTIVVKPASPLESGAVDSLTVKYKGTFDERICYADIDESTLATDFRFWLYSIKKRYGFITPDYVLLTSEALWYPSPGILYGTVFPELGQKQFTRFSLDVTTSPGLTAISQGAMKTDRPGTFAFAPESPQTRISLVIGKYKKLSIIAEGLEYSLYVMPGHDYFMKYFTKVKATLPTLVDTALLDYERQLQSTYPFSRFVLVEVPVQFCAHRRFAKADRETVQPEEIFLPEKGVLLRSADFKMSIEGMKRWGQRGGQTQTEEEVQSSLLTRFIQSTFAGSGINMQAIRRSMGSGGLGLNNVQRLAFGFASGATIEGDYTIFPQFYSFANYIKSSRFPVLDTALEQYLKERTTQNMRGFRMFTGTTDAEHANIELASASLADVLRNPEKRGIAPDVLKNKGNYLFTRIATAAGSDSFSTFLSDYLFNNQFKPIQGADFAAAIKEKFAIDIEPMLETWYEVKGVPAYILSNLTLREILEGEKKRYQVTFVLSNVGAVEGVATASFVLAGTRGTRSSGGGGGGGGGGRSGGGGGGGGGGFMMMMGGGSTDPANTRSVTLAAGQAKEIGMVFDASPNRMTVDTQISRNLPSTFSKTFGKAEIGGMEVGFSGERTLDSPPALTLPGEIVVDNEDAGFSSVSGGKESLLTRLIKREKEDESDTYIGFRFRNPPKVWRPTIMDSFYGYERRSAHYIAAGDGSARAIWSATIPENGSYDVYAYCPTVGFGGGPRGGGGPGGPGGGGGSQQRQRDQGHDMTADVRYIVHHDDGADEVEIDTKGIEAGWVPLGTYYLSAGKTEVELTNKTSGRIVIADAVKWVKRSEPAQRNKQ